MADPNFSWIYLIIFLAIPLARIIPRLIAKRRGQDNRTQQEGFESRFDEYRRPQMETRHEMKVEENLSKDVIVLRQLNLGVKAFESIQRNTGMDRKELDSILANLERDGLLKVVQKQGLLGPKIELYPTDKGFREFHS